MRTLIMHVGGKKQCGTPKILENNFLEWARQRMEIKYDDSELHVGIEIAE